MNIHWSAELWSWVVSFSLGPAAGDDPPADLGTVDSQTELAQADDTPRTMGFRA